MPSDIAFRQLLTLIAARGQQWLRQRIEDMPPVPIMENQIRDLAEIAVTAQVCTDLRKVDAPLLVFLRRRFNDDALQAIIGVFYKNNLKQSVAESAVYRILPSELQGGAVMSGQLSLADRLAMTGRPDPALLAEAEAFLRQSIPDERFTDVTIETYTWILALTYRFGAERPRFAASRTYGDAFANCLRFAEWAQRKRRLLPLVQAITCLRLIDPDFDAMPMLGEVISSQRPDGSFPARIGFGTADQDNAALRTTLATVLALHMAIYRGMRHPGPTLPMAA